jgi:DNA-binding transcriptional LysR family regulator
MSFFRQMEVFRAAMMSPNLTVAAERLLITQPAVTKQIQALEDQIGIKLFLRDGARLKPTSAARALFAQSERAFASMSTLERFAAELIRSTPQHLRICVMPMMSRLWLPDRLIQLFRAYPDLHLSVSTAPSLQILDLLETDQIDIGIALPIRPVGLTQSDELLVCRAVCILPQGHRLSLLETVGPEDLAGEDFLLLGPVAATRRDILETFAERNIKPKVKAEIDVAELAVTLVANGAGIAVIDDLTAEAHKASGAAIDIRPFAPRIDIAVNIYRTRSSAAMPLAAEVYERLCSGSRPSA